MKVEINDRGPDELMVDIRADELPGAEAGASDERIRRLLAGSAGPVAAIICEELAEPRGAPEQRPVSAITVRVVRTVVVAELTVPLPEGTKLWA